jgi:hypothetical protein
MSTTYSGQSPNALGRWPFQSDELSLFVQLFDFSAIQRRIPPFRLPPRAASHNAAPRLHDAGPGKPVNACPRATVGCSDSASSATGRRVDLSSDRIRRSCWLLPIGR